MCLVHELEKLVHDRLEEFPMCLEESRVLANNVHDVRRADGFVVLPSLHLGETQKVFDDSHQESFLGLFVLYVSLLLRVRRERVSSLIAPDIEPIAQQRVFKLFHDHSLPSIWHQLCLASKHATSKRWLTCLDSLSVMINSVSLTSRCVK
jgi:hypothetical protein